MMKDHQPAVTFPFKKMGDEVLDVERGAASLQVQRRLLQTSDPGEFPVRLDLRHRSHLSLKLGYFSVSTTYRRMTLVALPIIQRSIVLLFETVRWAI